MFLLPRTEKYLTPILQKMSLPTGKAPDPTDEVVGPYPTVVKQSSGKQVPVVQAYAYTKYLGNLTLRFSTAGNVISWKGNPILLDKSVPQGKFI